MFVILDIVTKQFEELPGIVAWYPPAGVTYTLLLVFGMGFTPAVTIALLSDSMVVYRMPQPLLLLFLWALIISLIYGATAIFLLKRIHIDWQLRKLRDVTWFIITTVIVSTLLAVLSVLSSAMSGGIPQSEIFHEIFRWWIGETVGVLTVSPFLLIYLMPSLKRFVDGQIEKAPASRPSPRLTISAIGQAASIILTLYWVFVAQVPDHYRPLFLIALPLIWIALQRGFKATSLAIFVVNTGVVLSLVLFRFDIARLEELQLTMIINSIVSLLMGAVVTERKLAEEKLLASETELLSLFAGMNDVVIVYDISGRYLKIAPTKPSNFYRPYAEMQGKTLHETLPKKQADFIISMIRESIQKDQVVTGEYALEVVGKVTWFSATASRLSNTTAILVAHDITKRKIAEESINRHMADLEVLYQNSMHINSLLNTEEISEQVMKAIAKIGLSWHHVAVHLYHPEEKRVEMLSHIYPGLRAKDLLSEKERLNKLIISPNQGFVGWVINHGKPIRCSNVVEDRRYIMAYPDIQSSIHVPMRVGKQVIGVISVESEKKNAFTKADERLLMTIATQASIAMENARLFTEIENSHKDLTLAYDATIEGWSRALDFRDKDTEGHSQRVTEMTWKLARRLGMSQAELLNIRWGALLHDIGKMGIPDAILLKPSSLTDLEWRIVKKHPIFAHDWLSPIYYLRSALDIPYCHHEKWNGTGYPRGLKEEAIPLAARIFAIIDVYDALTSDRPYRPAWSDKKALEYIQEQSGKHFDPDVVEAFLDNPSIQISGDT